MVLDSRLEDLRGYMFLKCGWMRLDTVGCFRFIEMLSGALCLLWGAFWQCQNMISFKWQRLFQNRIPSYHSLPSKTLSVVHIFNPLSLSADQTINAINVMNTHTHTIFLVNLCRTSYILYWGCDLELHVNVEVAQDYWPQTWPNQN